MNIVKLLKAIFMVGIGLIILAFAYRHRRTLKAKSTGLFQKARDWLVNEPKEKVTA
jgi:hypothetical protein